MTMKVFFLILLSSVMNRCLGSYPNRFDYLEPEQNGNDELPLKNVDQQNLLLASEQDNFILTDFMYDGEFERRISYEEITAKETQVNSSGNSLSLWQISNGKSLLQLIYSNENELIDCEHIRRADFVNNFLSQFFKEFDVMRSRNFSSMAYVPLKRTPIISNREFNRFIENDEIPDDFQDLQNLIPIDDIFAIGNLTYAQIKTPQDIPDNIRRFLNFRKLRTECHQRKRSMIKLVHDLHHHQHDHHRKHEAAEHLERKKRSLSDLLIAPNTKWCGRGQNADSYNELGGASRADKCCRKHDHCKANIQGVSTKWNLFNFRLYTISHCNCDIRQRRDLSNLLRIPGTKWCGKGWSAQRYSDLGGYSRADRCCRQHDKSCPFWIMGFETKYSLYNWRVNTLMHCKCDERFRTCLKMADTADANMVGKLFFNIVQTKCFVIKPEKICKKRSKIGKCEKKALRKRAHLRENRKF